MTAYDLSNDLAVHVALDNTIVIDDAKEAAANPDTKLWRPLLLVVPLRLGLTDINPIYFADLKVGFKGQGVCFVLDYKESQTIVVFIISTPGMLRTVFMYRSDRRPSEPRALLHRVRRRSGTLQQCCVAISPTRINLICKLMNIP